MNSKPIDKKTLRTVYIVTDSFLSGVALLMSMLSLTLTKIDGNVFPTYLFILFLTMALSRTQRAFVKREKLQKMINFVYAGVYVASAILLCFGGSALAVLLTVDGYFLTLIVYRVIKIIQNHKFRSILFNSILIILIGLFAIIGIMSLTDPDADELGFILLSLMALTVMASSLLHIIKISFTNIKLNLLRKIIRKTYASEILFGLTILVISFSFVFAIMDPSFKSYGDALWYCFTVITTIGFGDIVPTDILCKVLTVILGFYSIIVVAVITSIIVNFYNEVKNDRTDDYIDFESAPAADSEISPEPVAEADELESEVPSPTENGENEQ